jgi:polyhydroxyalkanoate synthesis regulator phasin
MAMGNPRESIKKAFLIGLGATVMTAEKVKELMDELVERGELSQQDAKSFGEDLKNRAVKEKAQFETRVRDTVDTYMKKAIESLGLVTRTELEALRAELKGETQAAEKGSAEKSEASAGV